MKKLLFLTLISFSTFAQTIVQTTNGAVERYDKETENIMILGDKF